MSPETAIATTEDKKPARRRSEKVAPTPIQLEKLLADEKSRRALYIKYVASELKENVDYGVIVGSKKTLLKPGAEKLVSLMHLTAKFRKDTETWEMLGNPAGTIAYVCELFTETGRLAAEGRGVCTVSEKQNKPNSAVKIAEKRALVDAVLRFFSMSDAFTQDFEDEEYAGTAQEINTPAKDKKARVSGVVEHKPVAPPKKEAKITRGQYELIQELVEEREVPDEARVSIVADLDTYTEAKAEAVIKKLNSLPKKGEK